jgi:hypothetical protein
MRQQRQRGRLSSSTSAAPESSLVDDVVVGGDRMHDEHLFCLEAKGRAVFRLSILGIAIFSLVILSNVDVLACDDTPSLFRCCWGLETVILGKVVAFQMGHVPLHFVLLPLAVLSEIHDIQVTSVLINKTNTHFY